MAKVPDAVMRMLESVDQERATIPPTELFNEGWMLRLVLHHATQGIRCLPFEPEPDSRWYSEALLYSAFGARFRGDRICESMTHADGVVGQFAFAPSTKAGLALNNGATQLVVLEAKMFSELSKGTRNAPGYDQAARTVACVAETLRRHGVQPASMKSLGFFVLAPRSQIVAEVFSTEVSVASIRRKIVARVAMYDAVRRAELDAWLADYVEPTLERITIGTLAWEDVISRAMEVDAASGEELASFYKASLRFNASMPAMREDA
jgi:hypothetical protein